MSSNLLLNYLSLACILCALITTSQTLSIKQDALSPGSAPAPLWAGSGALSGGQQKTAAAHANVFELIERIGPNMRSSSDYHDFDNIGLNESIVGWQLLHNQAQLFAENQVHFYGPKLERLLSEANVSAACEQSLNETLQSLERLDSWAVQSE